VAGAKRSWGRAAAFAAALLLVRSAAGALLARLALDRADALGVDALAAACTLALAAAAGASLSREGLIERLGLAGGRLRGSAALLGAVGLIGLSHAAEAVLELAGLDASPSLARFAAALSGLGARQLAFPLAALALGSALGEELFFRGFVQRGLERTLGSAGAIAVAALAFGAAHGDWAQGAAAAVLGLYLGALAWSAGSIRVAMLAHAANNALAVLEVNADRASPPRALAIGLALAALGLGALWSAHRDPRAPLGEGSSPHAPVAGSGSADRSPTGP
jgi:membrane protease YdiL (CAAX protease family)